MIKKIPINKPALCVTERWQAGYIMNRVFDESHENELRHFPNKDRKQINANEISNYPTKACLQIDIMDPLDP